MANLSVIVPIYNSEQYLRRCVDSLIDQKLNEMEIILVNDASPDNCIEIMREYELAYPHMVKVIDSKENLKQGGARNLGIKAATADYVGFVDSDDWVDAMMFKSLYEVAIERDADIVSCNSVRAVSNTEFVPIPARDLSSVTGNLDEHKRFEILMDGASSGIVSRIYRRNLLLENDLWFPERLFYEDNLWGPLVFLYATSYYHINENYYYYFLNPNSTVTSTESMHHFDRLIIETMKLEEYKARGFYDRYIDAIEYNFINLYYVNSLHLSFSRFSRPPFHKVFEMRKYMQDNFPEYRKSRFFDRVSDFGRVLTGLNDISPYKAYEWYKSVMLQKEVVQ
ncbi:glycosyltransferase [Paenibacillus marinisediminis]